uniref:Uncharacterized protein n=1 Tax=Arundo donax TaxID=35708 RepID=A0A0A9BHM6_ARUDO
MCPIIHGPGSSLSIPKKLGTASTALPAG